MTTNTAKQLILTDITRYDDVEMGTLELRVGPRIKRWKAIWLTNMLFGDSRSLPRGTLSLYYRNFNCWIDCPRISINRQTHAWIIPLDSSRWNDMGVNIYLCSGEGWPHPLSVADYKMMLQVMLTLQIGSLTVETPSNVCNTTFFSEEEITGMNLFWDE